MATVGQFYPELTPTEILGAVPYARGLQLTAIAAYKNGTKFKDPEGRVRVTSR